MTILHAKLLLDGHHVNMTNILYGVHYITSNNPVQ